MKIDSKKLRICTLLFLMGITSCKNVVNDKRIIDNTAQLNIITTFEHTDGQAVRLWADSLIYISSSPTNNIYIYDFNGNFIRTIGRSGPAPFENGTIWHFAFDEDKEHYWIHDYPKQIIKQQRISDDSLTHYAAFTTRSNVLYLKNNKFLVTRTSNESPNNNSLLLSIFNPIENKFEKNYDLTNLIPEIKNYTPEQSNYLLTGDFCKNDKGQIAQWCMLAGGFFLMDSTLNEIKYCRDVRNYKFPELKIDNNEGYVLNPKHLWYMTAFMDDKYLYLATTTNEIFNRWREGENYLLDVYELNSGKYLKSINLPKYQDEFPFIIAYAGGKLVVNYSNGTVAIYKFQL